MTTRTQLGSVVDDITTWDPAREAPDESLTYIDIASIDREAKVIATPTRLFGREAPSRARQRVRSGDVLVSTVRPALNAVARVPPHLDGATASTGFTVLRPKVQALESRYLAHWVRSPGFVSEMTRRATGASYPAVSDTIVKQSCLPLPPVPEQRRIANLLDRADDLLRKRREAHRLTDALLRSTFLEIFGDPIANPRQWPLRSFAEMMRDETALSPRIMTSAFAEVGQYPVIDQGQADVAGYCDDANQLCASTLPVVMFGDHTRAVKLVRFPFVVGADGVKVLAARPGVDAAYLCWLLRLLPIPDLGYSRHMREVKRLSFPTPPLSLQRAFACQVAAVERLKANHGSSGTALTSLVETLQSRAFGGAA